MRLQGEAEKRNHIYYEFDRNRDQIGAGGMGVVYRGKMVDENTGAYREVAIKEIQPEGDLVTRMTVLERARREASIQIRHDDMVEMLGFVETTEKKLGIEKQRCYVISEFLDGVTLDKVLAGNYCDYKGEEIHFARDLGERFKRDREQTATLIIKHVLSAIAALHDRGYLHRDIDPSNIMITSDGKTKLIDFGIAKKVGDLGRADNMQSEMGSFVGKVDYAAPELVSGNISQQNFTTDIYSVGVLFYLLLTGSLPYRGNRFDVMQAQLSGKPDLGKVRSKKYRAIVAKAMAKKQDKRFDSAYAMRTALDGPEPAPVLAPYAIAAAALVVVVVTLIIILGKRGHGNNGNNGGEIEVVVDTVKIEKQESQEEDVIITMPTRNADEMMSKPISVVWDTLMSESGRYNSAALYNAARYYNSHSVDSDANEYWNTVMIPVETARYLKETEGTKITTRRMEYILLCMAYSHFDDYKWTGGDFSKDKLGTMIRELHGRFGDYFNLPVELNDTTTPIIE